MKRNVKQFHSYQYNYNHLKKNRSRLSAFSSLKYLVVMYLCAMDIYFASFYEFYIWYRICYTNVVFLIWSVTTMWSSFFHLLQTCGLPSLICYNNVVFLLSSVTNMWSSFFHLLQQCGLPSFICYKHVVFLLSSVTTMWSSFFHLLQQCGLPSFICYNNVVFLLSSVTTMWSSFFCF
jgi:hypothetical protein